MERFGRMEVPVKEGDELDVEIEAMGEKGDGIAKKDGFVLFVPGTSTGEHVHIRVTRVLKRVGFAEVVRGGSAPKQVEKQQDEEEEGQSAEEEPSDSEDFGEEEQKQDE